MLSKYADKSFWTDTVDRTIASLAQGLVVALGAISAGEAGLLDVDWKTAFSMAGGYAVLSFLTSVSFRGNGEKIVASISVDPVEVSGELPPEEDAVVSGEFEAVVPGDVDDLEGAITEVEPEDLFEEVPYEPRHAE